MGGNPLQRRCLVLRATPSRLVIFGFHAECVNSHHPLKVGAPTRDVSVQFSDMGFLTLTFRAALVSALMACVCSNARGQQSYVEELIDAASRRQTRIVACQNALAEFQRRVEDFKQSLVSASASISATRGSKPVLKGEWRSLEIGEFESKDELQQRQAAAKQREQDLFESATGQWKARLSSQERDFEEFCRSSEIKTEKLRVESIRLLESLQSSIWHVPALPNHRRTLDRSNVTLPRFDRESMSFFPVAIPPSGTTEVRSSRPGNLIVRIEEASTASVRITLPSLSAAKAFKEAFEAGKITCVVEGGLDLGLTESPILLKPEVVRYEERADYGAVAWAVGTTLAHYMAGLPPEELERSLQHQDLAKVIRVVEQSEVKEAGTRFHFTMSPESVTFVDSARRPIGDVRVSFLADRPRVKTIRPDAQIASRELQPGDQIIRVGDRETLDFRAIVASIRAFGAGQSFDVTYRRAGFDADRKFKAEGGKPLGIDFE